MCILELSKRPMHESHYGYTKIKRDNKSRLLFTDTDSLVYKIRTNNVYHKLSNKNCLILVIILLSENITMIPTY